MLVRSAVLVLAACAGVAHAQSPGQPPTALAGDDSIYALRVDPAAYRGYDYVLLLDDGVVRLEADGRSSYTLRQVVQILTPEGVEAWGEVALWHTPARQRVRIDRMRVVAADGTILRDGPEHQQEAAAPVEPGAPVYSDRRALQATLGGIAPGAVVDRSYTIETVQPWLPGDFLFSWYVNSDIPIRRSRFVLDTPVGWDARVVERNLPGTPRDTAVAGRRRRTWTFAEVPAVQWERFAGTPNTVMMSIALAGSVSWRDVGAWYGALVRDRFVLTPEIEAAHAEQLRGAATLDDSLRATHRWVAQDIRYVSLSLGDGGYQPRLPHEVYETRFGDCKDKTTLFVSLVRRMGLTAYPVLVHSEGGVDSLLPSLKHFDHMIAATERGGRVQYVDVTSPLTPYDELPPALQHEVGLALGAAGPAAVVLPAAPPERNRFDTEIEGTLGRDGRFVGRVTYSARGTEQYDLRERFASIHEQSAKARNDVLRQYAQSVYASAVVDSAQYADGRDLSAPPRVTVWFSATNVVGRMAGKYYFELPLSTFLDAGLVGRLEAEGSRRFPIDVAQVNSPSVYRSSLAFQLPEGWKAELPAAVAVDGAFGYYRAEYRQAGRSLTAAREMGGLRGLVSPDSAPALHAWLRAVAADNTSMIVLHRGAGLALVRDTAAAVGALPDIMLRPGDLPPGAKIASEGDAEEPEDLLVALASTAPVEFYERNFAADQMVFTVGGSRLVVLQVTAAAFRSRAEALRPLDLLELFDLKSLMSAYLGQEAAAQASLGASRPIPLPDIGDRAAGWMLELVTPVATFDLGLLFATRGRVGTTMLAMGPRGLQESDLAGLLRTMDERVRGHDAYRADLAPDPAADRDVSVADSALAAATGVPLSAIPSLPEDTTAATTTSATFSREDGWPSYALNVEGKGLTFPLGGSPAISASLQVTLHDNAAQALKQVLAAEQRDRREFARAIMPALGSMVEQVAGGDSTVVEIVAHPPIGARSVVTRARLRGMFRSDVDAVVFARGRVSATVIVTRPPGAGDPDAAGTLARAMHERMRQLPQLPAAGDAPPAAALVTAVRRVLEAERVVDSLVEARDFEGAFRTIERARLSRAPVGFAATTWNSLCWYASLYGHARRALTACEAAVAPDTTNLAYRDSRGLGRAMAGDLAGAVIDFDYVVAHAAAGPFLDGRAAWLETLRAGENPFTPEVVETLKRD